MNKLKISTAKGLLMLLLSSTAQALLCSTCICESLEEMRGWKVDCSSVGLKKIPALSINIRILYLQNNSLNTVPPGTLDILRNLQEVDLSNNPWNCDCSILYLKQWLEDSHTASLANITCATPASVKMRNLSQLSGNELEGCRKPLPIKCLDFFWRDIVLIIVAIFGLILLSCILKCSKKMAYQVARNRHSSEVPLLQIQDLGTKKSE